jgi:REP element-mobilizing transposase RayT
MGEIKGWHSRGYLPHYDGGSIPQFITIRLDDAIPQSLLSSWKEELALWKPEKREIERIHRLEAYLDLGHGAAWLRDERIASMVQDALLYLHPAWYRLHAWVVMPNHVHMLLVPSANYSLSRIMKSRKQYTCNEANRLLHRTGQYWQEDYFDRYMRREEHYLHTLAYIENNPVKAGLCARPEDWLWSSAYWRLYHPDHFATLWSADC